MSSSQGLRIWPLKDASLANMDLSDALPYPGVVAPILSSEQTISLPDLVECLGHTRTIILFGDISLECNKVGLYPYIPSLAVYTCQW
jgi:hypothetical protein